MARGNITPQVALDTSSVRSRFEKIREFSPKLARAVRRDMRRSGDEIIAEQRAELAGPLPRGIRVARQKTARWRNAKTGKWHTRKLNVYEAVDVNRAGRGQGLRKGISESLRTRVVISEKRTGVSIRTTNAKKNGATFWQAKRFRHPTFGDRERMQYQAGQPYFWAPAFRGADRMARRIDTALDEALASISDT